MPIPNRDSSQTKYTEQYMENSSFDEDYGVLARLMLVEDPTTGALLKQYPSNGLNLKPFDYVGMALSAGDTTETYTFKSGGSGGTTTNVVVIVYTDSTREVLVSVTKTTP